MIIISLYIFGNTNLSNLLMLVYTIHIVFIWINIFIKTEIININLEKIPTLEELIIIIKSLKIYLINYFKDKEFLSLNKIIETEKKKYKTKQENEEERLRLLKSKKIPEFLIYTPIINLIFLFIKKTKYKYHFINWIMLTFILVFCLVLKFYGYLNSDIYLLIIIPICFGIWYSYHYFSYKMPFVYQIYKYLLYFKNLIIFKGKKINKKRKEINEVNLKVGEKK